MRLSSLDTFWHPVYPSTTCTLSCVSPSATRIAYHLLIYVNAHLHIALPLPGLPQVSERQRRRESRTMTMRTHLPHPRLKTSRHSSEPHRQPHPPIRQIKRLKRFGFKCVPCGPIKFISAKRQQLTDNVKSDLCVHTAPP